LYLLKPILKEVYDYYEDIDNLSFTELFNLHLFNIIYT